MAEVDCRIQQSAIDDDTQKKHTCAKSFPTGNAGAEVPNLDALMLVSLFAPDDSLTMTNIPCHSPECGTFSPASKHCTNDDCMQQTAVKEL